MRDILFYFDPLCPWCWMTANWVKSIKQDRQLNISWRPISLKLKNGDMPEPWSTRAENSLAMLRIVEHIRSIGEQDRVEDFYWSLGESIHRDSLFEEDNTDITDSIKKALNACGLDESLAEQMHSEDLTQAVQASTDEAIALSGEDVGTPIIGFKNDEGEDVALFGPVISELPASKEEALELWDAFMVFARKPYFWELKRTRNKQANVSSTFEA